MSAVSIATSLPIAPIVIPITLAAKTGASLIPSPMKAIFYHGLVLVIQLHSVYLLEISNPPAIYIL
jgi:hypothetical protein